MPIKPREGLADKHLLIDADNVRQQQDWDRLFSGLRKRPNDVLAWRVLSRGPAEADIAAKGHAYGQRINKSSHRSQNSVPSYQQPKHYPSRRVPPLLASPKLVYDLVRLTKFIAIQSTTLTEIEIAGVPLSLDMVKVLAEGIYHGGQMIRRFSLARGQIGDEGLKLLAPGLKTLLSLTILNLGACSLTEKSAVVLSDVLNGRAVKRQAAIWECTLRSRAGPPYDRGVNPAIAFRSNNLIASTNASIVTEGVYPGDAGVVAPLSSGALIIRGKVVPAAIKRLCLPHNDFGDEGVHTLMESLVEETGLAALDLPCNGITDLGARIVEQVLHLNKELQVVDLRSNFVSSEMWDMVCRRLCENRGTELQVVSATGEWADITRVKTTDPEVKWLPPTDPLRFSYYQAVVDAKSGRSKSRFRPTFSKNAKLVKKPVPVGARPPFKVGPAPVQGWGHHNAGPAQYAKFQLAPSTPGTLSLAASPAPSKDKPSKTINPTCFRSRVHQPFTFSESQPSGTATRPSSPPENRPDYPDILKEADRTHAQIENVDLRRRLREMEALLIKKSCPPERKFIDSPELRRNFDTTARSTVAGTSRMTEESQSDFEPEGLSTKEKLLRVLKRRELDLARSKISNIALIDQSHWRRSSLIDRDTYVESYPNLYPDNHIVHSAENPAYIPGITDPINLHQVTDLGLTTSKEWPTKGSGADAVASVAASSPQLDVLVQLMETSLQSFHTLLDKMEMEREAKEKRRRRRRNKHGTESRNKTTATSSVAGDVTHAMKTGPSQNGTTHTDSHKTNTFHKENQARDERSVPASDSITSHVRHDGSAADANRKKRELNELLRKSLPKIESNDNVSAPPVTHDMESRIYPANAPLSSPTFHKPSAKSSPPSHHSVDPIPSPDEFHQETEAGQGRLHLSDLDLNDELSEELYEQLASLRQGAQDLLEEVDDLEEEEMRDMGEFDDEEVEIVEDVASLLTA